MAQRERRDRDDLDDQLTGLAERLERTEMESDSLREAWQEARREVEHYKSKASGIEFRYKAAEEARERQHEESQKHLAMLDEAIKKANRLKSEANKRDNVISGLQTDLSTSVERTQSLENQLGGLKTAFSRVANQVHNQSHQKTDTARMLIDQMIKLNQLESQEEGDIPEQVELPDIRVSESEYEEDNGESIRVMDPRPSLGPNWQLLEDERPEVERPGSPSELDFFGASLENELEEVEQRRNLDDSLKLSGKDSESPFRLDMFNLDAEKEDSPTATDVDDDDDDERDPLPSRIPSTLLKDGVHDFDSGLKPNPSVYQKQEHPEFRLDLLEQGGPRKRVRVRKVQDNTVVKEPNPWKGSQKSRLPVSLVKDISRLTLQDKSGKASTQPSTKQVKSILKVISGNPHLERFKAHRPDRFKRSKRDKPSASNSLAPVEYTVMVDPAMAEDTNMFGAQPPMDNLPKNRSAFRPTQFSQSNNPSIHGNMFAPEVLAPPVAAPPTNANTTTRNGNAIGNPGPLYHYGPTAASSKRPVAEPLREYNPFGPPIKNSPKLPRIVRNNYPGAVYRPTPYGQDSTRLDLPWAAWMAKFHASKPEKQTPALVQAQPSWGFDIDFFQRGAGSMDLLPERKIVLLKWRITLMCMCLFFFLWLLLNSGRSINGRDLWMDANDIPRSVLMQIRGQPTYNPRWLDILEYKLIKWSGVNRVALG